VFRFSAQGSAESLWAEGIGFDRRQVGSGRRLRTTRENIHGVTQATAVRRSSMLVVAPPAFENHQGLCSMTPSLCLRRLTTVFRCSTSSTRMRANASGSPAVVKSSDTSGISVAVATILSMSHRRFGSTKRRGGRSPGASLAARSRRGNRDGGPAGRRRSPRPSRDRRSAGRPGRPQALRVHPQPHASSR
jgi:hypothetical protein